MITETKIIFKTLFYSFLKNYSTSKRSTIIFFKLCKANVNLWNLCFFVLQKVPRPFKQLYEIGPLGYPPCLCTNNVTKRLVFCFVSSQS